MTKPHLGVCYYPEQWDRSKWAGDAARMADLGISRVRIGEFAWAHMEPEPGRYHWGWLDEAIDTLASEGLFVVLGTPTATPPKWLVDRHPDILPWDRHLRPRGFGSRRHYCFSSPTYLRETERIVAALGRRYGRHPAVVAWQTDNEYGCHDTVRSYSPNAAAAFRLWLHERYRAIADLNEAWGTSFWSQRYRGFEEVDLPAACVTEPNPSHVLDFYRFSSDQVVRYNRLQADIIRSYAPGRDIIHNFMGFFTDFDHFAVGADIDVAAWDSYPLGFLDVADFSPADKARYLRQGHPDIAGFHHDLYRAVGRGRFEVMEQQPGPVNWAGHNPAPLPGMVRLWTHEAIAHGAEGVSYFRWRQAPVAQEQMHAGLMRPDDQPAPGYGEARAAAGELVAATRGGSAPVAVVFSYEACWLSEIQPQGREWSYLRFVFEWYSVLRRAGLNADFVAPGGDLSAYKLVIVPCLPHIDAAALDAFEHTRAQVIYGPRTGSRGPGGRIPRELAPGPLQGLIPVKIALSESLPSFQSEEGSFGVAPIAGRVWLDHVETALLPLAARADGRGLLYRHDNHWLLTTVPDERFYGALVFALTTAADVRCEPTAPDVRLRADGAHVYGFNYGPEDARLPVGVLPVDGAFDLGAESLPPAGVARWRKGGG